MSEVDDFAKAQAEEYGQWVAVEQIWVGTALAHNPGDPVPASNVAANGWDKQGLVRRIGVRASSKSKEA